MSLLDDLYRGGALRTIDHAFAQSLRRLDPATPDEVLAAAALASLAVSQGHAGYDFSAPASETNFALPDAAAWQASLRDSRWVAVPMSGDVADPRKPLAFENGLLYLRRYRE